MIEFGHKAWFPEFSNFIRCYNILAIMSNFIKNVIFFK